MERGKPGRSARQHSPCVCGVSDLSFELWGSVHRAGRTRSWVNEGAQHQAAGLGSASEQQRAGSRCLV